MLGEPTFYRLAHTVFDGHTTCWMLLGHVGTCFIQHQTFDPTPFNISFVLVLDV